MFFIGIFGIDSKEKEIKNLLNSYCKKCNISSDLTLIKSFTFFHFFFIPLFKWNENYYVVCNKCGSIYSIPKEKGKAIEKGENIEITYWDLNEVKNSYGDYYSVKRCSKCNKEVENGFEYCPYCGEKIK